eukprot:TRINITY_DN19366_c0_g1_i1.p1 TRINITY_DN19366_c0_g1~~TRINITY_DN19366_c0_g1_i1.p1  ORF type:complete len:577 (+),score=180.28 TRINITY_DN19366_c0_g1_i1:79-1809(+)
MPPLSTRGALAAAVVSSAGLVFAGVCLTVTEEPARRTKPGSGGAGAQLLGRLAKLEKSLAEIAAAAEAAQPVVHTAAAAARPKRRAQPVQTPPLRRGLQIFTSSVAAPVFVSENEFKRVSGGPRKGALAWDACSRGGVGLPQPDAITGFKVEGDLRVWAADVCAMSFPYAEVSLHEEQYGPASGTVDGGVYWEIVGSGPPVRTSQRNWTEILRTHPPLLPVPPVGADRPPRRAGARPVVAFAITVTRDGNYLDGAAVMGHSVLSVHRTSKFAAELVAMLKPGCTKTRKQLAALRQAGQEWRILERSLPINLALTPAEYRKEAGGGCCGADELIKLHAWTLVEYHRVAHLDADTLVLQNIDDVLARDASLVYTADWGMSNDASRKPPVQGGFLVVKPDMAVFRELQTFAQRGGFRADGSGWEGSHIGHFWGGSTIQGLLAFYFTEVRPTWGHAEDHCTVNAQADSPFRMETAYAGKRVCVGRRRTCADCRSTPFSKVRTAHYTVCQKPWTCRDVGGLCRQLHSAWFEARREVVQLLRPNTTGGAGGPSDTYLGITHGACKCEGSEHCYRPIEFNEAA